MKYCSFCGCYIPDDWDNCPACGKENYTLDFTCSNKTILNNERFYPYYSGLYSSSEFKWSETIRLEKIKTLDKSI